jgi:serine/threonine protein phosphatase 1
VETTSPSDLARGPAGRRLYAVGDIHGRLDLLDTLLGLIGAECTARPPATPPTLVFLGDVIDRGPESARVIERLRRGPAAGEPLAGSTWVTLCGNHETYLRDALSDPAVVEPWLANGGRTTIRAYLGEDGPDDPAAISCRLRRAVPAEDVAFLATLPLCYAFGDYLCVHAGLRPGVAPDRQAPFDLLWIREPFLSWGGPLGAVVVHGHTPVAAPEIRANRIAIDTAAWKTGRLTALAIEEDRRWLLATGTPTG